ncbi:MAG: DNA gyrase subunit A [Chloroflexi bacterium]|nr:DNA gyrase subunit A [Chloroflexota bacterium]
MEVGLVQRVDIEEKMRSAYLSYAMSVITARALPDVRDGLKPVQRRILYAMYDMGLLHDRPTRKSARIVGEVLGKYHPHGDSAVYDAMVRMAQDFSMRYTLVDGQGNFGSIDGDMAAAMRYTEARLTALGEEMLLDIDKDTINLVDNFDGSLQEPEVLPAKLPNLLVNGVGGIAVGMATNIPPHNLGEIVDALIYLIDRYDQADDVTVDELMRFVRGPDFPTGGTILGTEGIRQAYATGKGRVITRSRVHLEELRGGHQALIVTELPYQVNKSTLVERIASLVREDRIQGISDLRDESDRTGMRIVIELKRNQDPEPVLADLLKYTQMQNTFGVNMLALVDGEPRLLSLKRVLLHYIEHRRDVLVRRTRYELERARARAHILEGLLLALDHLDEVIETIRRSQTADTARNNLMRKFKMTEIQAQAVLDMQLRRLAALERKRIQEEYDQITARIAYLEGLLESKSKILGLIQEDLLELKKKYADPRRTTITELNGQSKYCTDNLVPDEELWVVVTREGFVRRSPLADGQRDDVTSTLAIREQNGLLAAFEGSSQERVIFFTDRGRAFALPAHQLPDAAQQPEGLAVSTLVRLEEGERVVDVLHVPACEPGRYVTMATRQGKVKRLALTELESLSREPIEVMGLAEGDVLVRALATKGGGEMIAVTAQGRAIRFAEDEISIQGRSATGVKGVSLQEGEDALVDMDLVREHGELVVLTAQGYAKRTPIKEYILQGRGGQGSYTVDGTKLEDTGPVVGARVVLPDEEIVVSTRNGSMVREPLKNVPSRDRATWGRLVTRSRRGAIIALAEGDVAIGIACLAKRSVEEGKGGEGAAQPAPLAPVAHVKRAPSAPRQTQPTSTRQRVAKVQEQPPPSSETPSDQRVSSPAKGGESEKEGRGQAASRRRARRPATRKPTRRSPSSSRQKS